MRISETFFVERILGLGFEAERQRVTGKDSRVSKTVVFGTNRDTFIHSGERFALPACGRA